MNTLAERFRFAIDEAGLSVTAAAKKCGIPVPRLNDIVRGITANPQTKTVTKFAAGMDLSIGWVLTGAGQMKQSPLAGQFEKTIAAEMENDYQITVQISGDENELLKKYRGLDDYKKKLLLSMAETISDS